MSADRVTKCGKKLLKFFSRVHIKVFSRMNMVKVVQCGLLQQAKFFRKMVCNISYIFIDLIKLDTFDG
jgi:hypothetical protein